MARKSIFQLVEESYDFQNEIRKINSQFENTYYFEANFDKYTLKDIIRIFLFSEWKYRGTCITLDEFIIRADAKIPLMNKAKENNIINNLELMENCIKLYFDNSVSLCQEYNIQYSTEFTSVFCELIKTLEKRMGLVSREYKDRIVIYPRNAPLEKILDLCEDEDVQWELIRYEREDLNLTEKRKSLAYLATSLYIEEDSNEKDKGIKSILENSTNILNNLHIRHNNKTGKWENKALETIDEKEASALCDMVYNEMLTIILLRKHKEYQIVYDEFREKQKEAAALKKAKKAQVKE